MRLPPRVAKIINQTRGQPAAKRISALNEEARAVFAERRLSALESLNVQFGGGQGTLDLALEDPRYDSGDYPWDEVGFAGGFHPGGSFGLPLLRREHDLIRARNVARAMWAENEFAIGAHRLRQSYIAGTGVTWRLVARDLDREDASLTERANESLREFTEANRWPLVEREAVLRTDRDGETFWRLFANAGGPMVVRTVEPEFVRQPVEAARDQALQQRLAFGVEFAAPDIPEPVAYWITDGVTEPVRVERTNDLTGLVHVVHIRGGTDLNARRGWPLLWAARKNLVRAEKLLRNMSIVAALQAAIAVIRKHEAATKTEVEAFLDSNRDLLVSNEATGKDTRYRGIEGGIVLDTGPGITYEAPVSSVNAANNVEVLRAELRSVAAMLNMPESMFTSQIDGGFAGGLVAEAPFTKYMSAEQDRFGWEFRATVWEAVRHEVFWGRLPERVLEDYRLVGEFTSLEVRDFLRESQKYQIEHTAGVLSTKTWRQKAGYDDEIERRNMEAEPSPAANPTDKPAPGDSDGGPGGSDQAGNTDDPGSAADTNFAQKDAQSLREAESLVGGDVVSAVSELQRKFGALIGKDPTSKMVLSLLGILADPALPASSRVAAALDFLSKMEPATDPAEPEQDETPAADAGGEVIPGFPV
jgi:hypothetical protein